MTPSLQEIYETIPKFNDGFGGDKGTTHSYIPVYDQLFREQLRKKPIRLLEIGVFKGQSIKMWKDYFHPESDIVGVDIEERDLIDKSLKRNVMYGNATTEEFADFLADESFDVIIDDGSHHPDDQIDSFNLLWSKLKYGGYYVIEDVINFDVTKAAFAECIEPTPFHIHDGRKVKGVGDDVMIIYLKRNPNE